MQFWALIVDSFRESLDRKIFWVMAALTLVVAAAMACIGFEPGKISILFGTWVHDTDRFTGPMGLRTDRIATIVVEYIMDTVLGWIGVLLAVIATAGFFPTMLERGGIEVVLAKPIARWRLFLGKYVSSMVFVFVHSAFFVVVTFLVAGFRWGAWLPGYLLTIPLIVVLFSYLYGVSVLAAMFFRSTVAAVLLTLGAWVLFTGAQGADDLFTMFPNWKEQRVAYQTIHWTRWALPKTQDVTYLAKKWSRAAQSTELMPTPDEENRDLVNRADQAERERMAIHPLLTIGSSLLFEAVLVAFAMRRFSKMDF